MGSQVWQPGRRAVCPGPRVHAASDGVSPSGEGVVGNPDSRRFTRAGNSTARSGSPEQVCRRRLLRSHNRRDRRIHLMKVLLEGQLHTDFPGDGQQVKDGVGADPPSQPRRPQRSKGLPIQDVRGRRFRRTQSQPDARGLDSEALRSVAGISVNPMGETPEMSGQSPWCWR